MIYPRFNEVQQLAQSFTTIPICKSVLADTETPIGLFHRLPSHSYSFLLESAEGGEKWSRYSFMGVNPFQVLTGKDGIFTVQDQQGERIDHPNNPISFLEECLSAYQSPHYEDYPPFLGGAVGYFAYEAMRYFEPTCAVTKNSEGQHAYDVHLMFFDHILIFDHFKQKVILVAHLRVPHDLESHDLKERYEKIVLHLERWAKELFHSTAVLPSLSDFIVQEKGVGLAQSTISKETYMNLVEQAKEYIRAGDIFQIVPSQRWTWEEAPSPMEVYRILRVVNPSPYMFYLKMGEETIVGSSPELLVRLDEQMVETRPIAGSRPRGCSKEDDECLIADLLADEKERAEHVMLVDLGRNDLGRVAKYGTVQVTSYMNIEKYSHVMHMVSHIKAERDQKYSRLDVLKACFPAGTVSGSPKIRAMEMIAELEPHPRGVYAGSIGYFSFTGHLDSCIAIRTIYFKDGKAYVQAGGGIVADSDPEKEYEETVSKAKGMLRALELASEKRKVESVR